MAHKETINALTRVELALVELRAKIEVLIELHRAKPLHFNKDMLELFNLPNHLRKTFLALSKLGGKGTADDVSKVTERARAVESGYLNQLVALDQAIKYRVGRKVFFELKPTPRE